MGERMVTLAVIIGAHGIAGECRLKLFTDDLKAYPGVRAGGRDLRLLSLRHGANGAIARFEGIGDRNAAELLRGTELSVPRSALPTLGPGEYYHADLIGLPCLSDTGEALGRVVAVENFGAGDVIEIGREGGGTFMVPMNKDAVPDWNDERLVVDAAFIA
ncbi:MAG: 16S rRNA processing protein RimM [Sphingomonas sp.]|nr:MAG: 16S rRNA processing protein RimM [Sphingomonas sp.]